MKINSKLERDSIVSAAEAAFLRAKFFEGLMRGGEPLPRDVVYEDLTRGNVRGSILGLDGFYITQREYVSAVKGVFRGYVEISHRGLDFVVWVMQYDGYYDEAALAYVQSVLHDTYRRGNFRGGRGPEKHVNREMQLMYFNLLRSGTGKFSEPFMFSEQVQTTGSNSEVRGQINGSGECTI